MYVAAAEVEILGLEYEEKPVLRKQPLKICVVRIHTLLDEDKVNGVKLLTCRYYNDTSPVDYLHQDDYFLYYMFS